jgi:hypothetical protein
MQFQLRLPDRGSVLVLRSIRIGRDPRNDVVLNGALVSRWHAAVLLIRGGLAVRDEHSMNGTFVNDQRVQGLRSVRAGDSIRVGGYTFRVEACASARMAAPAANFARAEATRLRRRCWIMRGRTGVYLALALAALVLFALGILHASGHSFLIAGRP